MGLLEDINSGKYNLIILIVVLVFIFHIYWTKYTEPMTDVSQDIKDAIRQIYNADIEAIRNLSEIANKLQSDGLIVPGKLTMKGPILTEDIGYHPDLMDGAIYRAEDHLTIASNDLIKFRSSTNQENTIEMDVGNGSLKTNGEITCDKLQVNKDAKVNSNLSVSSNLNVSGTVNSQNITSKNITTPDLSNLNINVPSTTRVIVVPDQLMAGKSWTWESILPIIKNYFSLTDPIGTRRDFLFRDNSDKRRHTYCFAIVLNYDVTSVRATFNGSGINPNTPCIMVFDTIQLDAGFPSGRIIPLNFTN